MADPPRLRRAEPSDVPVLLDLLDQAVAWLVTRGRSGQWGDRPLSESPALVARAEAWTAAGAVTVAERDGRCVGLLAASTELPPHLPAGLVPPGTFYVHLVVTDRTELGRGAGAALLAEAERLAREQGAPALALDHWSGSPELGRRYVEAGYTVEAGTFTIEQRGEPWTGIVRVRPLDR